MKKQLTLGIFFDKIHTCETEIINMLPWLSW